MENKSATNKLFNEAMLNIFTPGYINFKEFSGDHVLLNVFDESHESRYNINEDRLKHNLNYLYHVVSFAFLERFFKSPYIVDEFYKYYVKPYLSIDIRTQRKHLTDTITLDNFMGAIGAAFLKYITSDKSTDDMTWFVDKYVLLTVDNMTCEDETDPSGYFFKFIVPKLSNECTVKDITRFSTKLITELAKMAFTNHFDCVITYMIKRSKRYKALKPYIDNIDILMNGNVPSLYGSCNTLDGYIKDLIELQKNPAMVTATNSDNVDATCTGIIEGVGNIIKPLLNIVDSSGYPWRLRYESILSHKTDNYTEEIKRKLESELDSCIKAMVVEKETYQEKLSNCYGFDLVDHIYQLFDSKLTSTRYFDIDLYIRNKQRQFLNGGKSKC